MAKVENKIITPFTIKRLSKDIINFTKSDIKHFKIYPNENNILEIYFLMYGMKDSVYENGEYIGKIVHNTEYPFKAPDYYILTPNGRFDINKKICLTNSSYHQSDWVASWNLVLILEGLFSIWHSEIKEDKTGISHINKLSNNDIKIFTDNSILYNKIYLDDIYSKLRNN